MKDADDDIDRWVEALRGRGVRKPGTSAAGAEDAALLRSAIVKPSLRKADATRVAADSLFVPQVSARELLGREGKWPTSAPTRSASVQAAAEQFLIVGPKDGRADQIAAFVGLLYPEASVDQVSEFDDALRFVSNKRPDAVIVDMMVPGGFERLRGVVMEFAELTWLVLAADEPELVFSALDAGVAGFIPLNGTLSMVREAIEVSLAGGCYLPKPTAEAVFLRVRTEAGPRMLAFAREHELNSAETSVFLGLCAGVPVRRIAANAGVAVSTVRSHVASIRAKTGASTIRALLEAASVVPPPLRRLRDPRTSRG